MDNDKHALPADVRFYEDIFANGTRAGMKMFEQDFMCSINTATNLTRSDIYTGVKWFAAMDGAARGANSTGYGGKGISLQFCMMNPAHVLASSLVYAATNGRATRDNHPGKSRVSPGDGKILGISSLLHYALGIWPSRDNVWTNASVASHGGPEPMVKTQSLMAVLSGGPYGPSDGARSGNKSLLMRSCRDDGLLLRADKPITILDAALLALPFGKDVTPTKATGYDPIHVWSTFSRIPSHSEPSSSLRYYYILGLDLARPFSVHTTDLDSDLVSIEEKSPGKYVAWEYWTGVDPHNNNTVVVDNAHPFPIPAPPLSNNSAVITSSYHVLSPSLTNGWTYLGEPGKFIAASRRRVAFIDALKNGIQVRFRVVVVLSIILSMIMMESK